MRPTPPGQREARLGDLFTARKGESEIFRDSLAAFRRHLDRDGDVGVARHNVLAFHGVGGVGKTRLSQQLEDWARGRLPIDSGWGYLQENQVAATARIDLHASQGQVDVSSMLLSVRAGVAPLKSRWSTFDLALAAYWSAARPNDLLSEHSRGDGLARAVTSNFGDVMELVGAAADLALLGPGAGLAVRAVRKGVDKVSRGRRLQEAIGADEGFAGFLRRCADEPSATDPRPDIACEIASALAWELATISPCPLVTVFVDATERLDTGFQRVAEGYLNELAHRMPNVLFVLTGRNEVRWHDDSRGRTGHRGQQVWPGLVPGAQDEPRQHRVAGLSEDDTRHLVRRIRAEQTLPMDDEVVERLVTASRGLPEYLELARVKAVSVRDAGGGRRMTLDDVSGSLDDLALRVLDDVPDDEQRAMRAACLFRTFDVDLIATAADVDHGCAERAVSRSMIEPHGSGGATYRMHDAVREAIRHADHREVGGWSERDWEKASTRAARVAHERHDAAKERDDHRGVLDAVGLAITLACEQETSLEPSSSNFYQDWLCRAIVFAPSVEGLRSRTPETSRTPYGQGVLNFITAKSTITSFEERLRLLRTVFDADHPMSLPAGRHLGYALRNQCHWDDALAVFDEVTTLSPAPVNRRQRPLTLSRARRFDDARAAARDARDSTYVTRVGEYAHGRPERYFAEIENRTSRLDVQGRQREVLEERGDYLARRALLKGDVGADEVRAFSEEVEVVGHSVATRDALRATALCHEVEPEEAKAAVQRLEALDRAASATGAIGFRYAMAEFCDALAAGDRTRLEVLHDKVVRTSPRDRSWIPVECFLESVGLPVPQPPTQWLEPYEDVLARWTTHLDAHLERRRSSRRSGPSAA